jgi:hypothetical protein
MPSRVFDSIDSIIALLETAGLTVLDGTGLTGDYQASVWVGYDGDPDGDWKVADIDQEWAGLGTRARNEMFDVVCAIVAPYDGESVKSGRDSVKALFATVESTLRADPSFGFSSPYIAGVQPRQLFNDEAGARLVFSITVKTRV